MIQLCQASVNNKKNKTNKHSECRKYFTNLNTHSNRTNDQRMPSLFCSHDLHLSRLAPAIARSAATAADSPRRWTRRVHPKRVPRACANGVPNKVHHTTSDYFCPLCFLCFLNIFPEGFLFFVFVVFLVKEQHSWKKKF